MTVDTSKVKDRMRAAKFMYERRAAEATERGDMVGANFASGYAAAMTAAVSMVTGGEHEAFAERDAAVTS